MYLRECTPYLAQWTVGNASDAVRDGTRIARPRERNTSCAHYHACFASVFGPGHLKVRVNQANN